MGKYSVDSGILSLAMDNCSRAKNDLSRAISCCNNFPSQIPKRLKSGQNLNRIADKIVGIKEDVILVHERMEKIRNKAEAAESKSKKDVNKMSGIKKSGNKNTSVKSNSSTSKVDVEQEAAEILVEKYIESGPLKEIIDNFSKYVTEIGITATTTTASIVKEASSVEVMKKLVGSYISGVGIVGTISYISSVLAVAIENLKSKDSQKKTENENVFVNSNVSSTSTAASSTISSGKAQKVNVKSKVKKDTNAKETSLNIDKTEKSFEKFLEGTDVETSAIKNFAYKNEIYEAKKDTFVLSDNKLDKLMEKNNKLMEEITKGEAGKDDLSLQKLKDISTSIFNTARETLNGETKNIDINHTALLKEMSELLKNVKEENREVAELMLSESILDLRYIKNPKAGISSLRMANVEKRIVIE